MLLAGASLVLIADDTLFTCVLLIKRFFVGVIIVLHFLLLPNYYTFLIIEKQKDHHKYTDDIYVLYAPRRVLLY